MNSPKEYGYEFSGLMSIIRRSPMVPRLQSAGKRFKIILLLVEEAA
jgi:hypothetical protein